jgi:hypothetical protein
MGATMLVDRVVQVHRAELPAVHAALQDAADQRRAGLITSCW